MKGAHTNYTVKTSGYAVFRIKDDWKVLELEGTSADEERENITGLGLVYNNQFEGEWTYYLDFLTVFTE
jgi:hypothetical protein